MSQANRIAFVCPRFDEQGTVGGAENLLRELALRTSAGGREVHFLTTCARNHFTWANEKPAGVREFEGMTVHQFRVDEDRDLERFLDIQDRISHGGEVSDEEEQAWLDNNVNSRDLVAHLLDTSYDRVVAGPYLFGLTWRAIQAHPGPAFLVPCLHDEPFAQLRIMQRLFRKVSGFLFNAEPERRLAFRLFDLSAAHTAVVGLGLDAVEADPKLFSRRHGLQSPYVVYAGRREPLKGTPMLADNVDAFRRRTGRDIKLVITGSGEIEAPASLYPHIIDCGFAPDTEKAEAMAGAVAFLHPSVNESLSIVILEAWLVGTPCLVTAFSDVLRYQCEQSHGGLWFRNYPEFEAQLSLLLDRPEIRDQLGQNGKQFVKREYNWDAVEKRLLTALDGDMVCKGA